MSTTRQVAHAVHGGLPSASAAVPAHLVGKSFFHAVESQLCGLHIKNTQTFVISLVREPCALCIGSFRFQQLATLTSSAASHVGRITEAFVDGFRRGDLRLIRGGVLGDVKSDAAPVTADPEDVVSESVPLASRNPVEAVIETSFDVFGFRYSLSFKLHRCPGTAKDAFLWQVIMDMYRGVHLAPRAASSGSPDTTSPLAFVARNSSPPRDAAPTDHHHATTLKSSPRDGALTSSLDCLHRPAWKLSKTHQPAVGVGQGSIATLPPRPASASKMPRRLRWSHGPALHWSQLSSNVEPLVSSGMAELISPARPADPPGIAVGLPARTAVRPASAIPPTSHSPSVSELVAPVVRYHMQPRPSPEARRKRFTTPIPPPVKHPVQKGGPPPEKAALEPQAVATSAVGPQLDTQAA